MARYLDDLFHIGDEHYKWAIVGAGVMPFDNSKREALREQDWLNTLVERDDDKVSAIIVGSMIDFVPVEDDHGALKKALLDPAIKIVSMTVNEGGYYSSMGKFNPEHPKITEDINNPETPETVFGMIVQALKKRRQAGDPAFTVMSCDNFPHNGDVTRDVVIGLAERIDNEHANWIGENVGFPNSMVDRITPATSDQERQYVKEEFGIEDAWPVCCETFRQWVIEDSFPQGRPALERVGVMFVPDVTPYEKMKIRILNGGHASLCYPAALLGIKYVHEAMEHPVIGPFLDTLERTEIIPGVPPVPDMDTAKYWELITKRFSNPMIKDTIERICYDGASRQPKFIVSSVADRLKDGRMVDGLALVSAMWCRYCQGKTEDGTEILPNDPVWESLNESALKAAEYPSAWVGMSDIYSDVGKDARFIESFSSALRMVINNGAEAAMRDYVEKITSG